MALALSKTHPASIPYAENVTRWIKSTWCILHLHILLIAFWLSIHLDMYLLHIFVSSFKVKRLQVFFETFLLQREKKLVAVENMK